MTDTSIDLERRADQLRRQMVDVLASDGALTSSEWRAAFAEVPRHTFVPVFYEQRPTRQRAVDASSGSEWLAGVYQDVLLVIRPDARSSSTVPNLMALMLEALAPEDGQRVLEIGTGSGYNAALLSHRLGDHNVVTVDIDPELVQEARTRLSDVGYRPTLVAGDGAGGWAQGAPYDRLIATCAVEVIPSAWLAQMRPGGRLVVPVATGVAVLDVDGPNTGSGRFLPGSAFFMPLRAEERPVEISSILQAVAESTVQGRPTNVEPDVWLDSDFRFLLAVAVPGLRYLTNLPATGAAIYSHPDGSWAQLLDGRAVQSGPQRLWDAVERAHEQWEELKHPGREQFTLTVYGSHQQIHLAGTDLAWSLAGR